MRYRLWGQIEATAPLKSNPAFPATRRPSVPWPATRPPLRVPANRIKTAIQAPRCWVEAMVGVAPMIWSMRTPAVIRPVPPGACCGRQQSVATPVAEKKAFRAAINAVEQPVISEYRPTAPRHTVCQQTVGNV